MKILSSQNKIPLLVIAGPTASGKTALSVLLAKFFGSEVVSADSMQIYKGMDIATAKPDSKEMDGVKHHMLSIIPPDKRYSVAEYAAGAKSRIEGIYEKGKLPILAGGTGLYISSLINNISFSKEEHNPELRAKLSRRAQEEGAQNLLDELSTFDPETAAKLHINDINRIIRAMELYYSAGITKSEQDINSKNELSSFFPCIIILDSKDRSFLYDRIEKRVDLMLKNGLLEETEYFYKNRLGKTAVQAIGYKELFPYLDGDISLEQAVLNLKQSTRRYAKRQLTWFRKMENAAFLFIDEFKNPKDLFESAKNITLECFSGGGYRFEDENIQ